MLPLARRLRWPLPALLSWCAAWALHTALLRQGWPQPLPLALATALGIGLSLLGAGWWRRAIIAAGFPCAMLLTGGVQVPLWVWPLLLLSLLLVYPLNAWRDAPLFPTPARALDGLPALAPVPEGAGVLDAGCGLGHGLVALRRAYPQAVLHGVEQSWPLRLACALRCPWARVRQGDMWRQDWGLYTLVYLFQRPESMAGALAKARREMRADGWLVSLEFEAAGEPAAQVLRLADGRPVWVYAVGHETQSPSVVKTD